MKLKKNSLCVYVRYKYTSSVSCWVRFVNQNKWPTLLHGRADVTTRYIFIGNLDLFPLISLSNIVIIKQQTPILKIIAQCDIKHIITLLIKTITSVLNFSILATMCVSIFISAVILYMYTCCVSCTNCINMRCTLPSSDVVFYTTDETWPT